MIRDIEKETLAMHARESTVPLGATAVRKVHPHQRPTKENRSPRPQFHAASKDAWMKMKEAYGAFVAAFADAAERLKRGDPEPGFPPNCFPPGLPFVPPCRAVAGFV